MSNQRTKISAQSTEKKMEVENGKKRSSYSWLACCIKCFPISSSAPSSPSQEDELLEKQEEALSSTSKKTTRTPGGWKAMPYVLGMETFERLATMGLLANFMIFLLTQFHMEQAEAANFLNVWSAATSFAPLLGAFLADAYVGRFWTIAVSSFAHLLGMAGLTLIAWMPRLHPAPCTQQQLQLSQCHGPTSFQLGILVLAIGVLSIGSGGIRPCNLPFGLDQFDAATEEGRKGMKSFFNWYYVTFTVVMMLALTVVVYIQDNVSWVLGFGLPTLCMLGSIVVFFLGTRVYVYVKPEGSVFSSIAQAAVAAYKKRRIKLPAEGEANVVFYNPPSQGITTATKLPLTKQFRFLNKAAVVLDGEVKPDGFCSNPWRLCSIQQIEEFKCLIRIIPVWASGIICFTSIAQQGTFTISQALKMDRHLGPKFQIPPGSLAIISMIAVGLWLPFYDRVLVPAIQKITKIEGGISLLQRMGIGMVISILSMVVAGLVERMRRSSAISHGRSIGVAPISVLWLAPQLGLMGFAEAFNIIGQMEFYYKEFPESMKSMANCQFFITMAGANYLSSLIVIFVHKYTGSKDGRRPDWLTNDINAGRVDYFYYLIAGMGVLNLVYFLIIARRYHYKGTSNSSVEEENGEKPRLGDVELNDIKQ